ncbi:MAG: alpha/beta hydrolase [Magnetococcales bacterium]|nr:alpha/beta hydrolase [Magnetococcales bacterium]
MSKPLIIFSHGKEGTPNGSKILQLTAVAKEHNCQTLSMDYRTINSPDSRVDKLLNIASNHPAPLVLVGSSMGSYISIVASKQIKPKGLFLLAPALYLDGYKNQNPIASAKLTSVVHGWSDDVVPVANAITFSQKQKTRLHLLDADHRLLSAMPIIKNLFSLFLDELITGEESDSF